MFWKRTVTSSKEFEEIIINTIREPLALNQDLRVVSVSRFFMSTASLHSNHRWSGSSGKEKRP
jgi:hypothetical protein